MTTPTLTKGEEVAVELKKGAHWKLVIEPHRYRRVLESPRTALETVRAAVVRIGVDEFPVIDSFQDNAQNSEIEGGWEGWSKYGRTEAWRVMCSGQFVAIAGVEEDLASYDMGVNTTHLTIATRNVMEFVEFARRFTKSAAFGVDGQASVRLSLRNVEGRTLTDSPPSRVRQRFTSASNSVELMEQVFPSELSETPFAVERELLKEIFARFGWEPPTRVLDDLVRQTASLRL